MPGLEYEPTMVGRDDEIRQLKHHLDSALAGKGATIFIGARAQVGP